MYARSAKRIVVACRAIRADSSLRRSIHTGAAFCGSIPATAVVLTRLRSKGLGMDFHVPSRSSRAGHDGRDGGRLVARLVRAAADVKWEKLSADHVSALAGDTQGFGRSLSWLGLPVACLLSLLCLGTMPGSASAATSVIPSDPLRVIVPGPGQVDVQ